MTSPSAALLALAERCEREEPSRELDEDIAAVLVGATPERQVDRTVYHRDGMWVPVGLILTYTTSLDAAETLVPEGFVWAVDNLSGPRAHVLGGEDDAGNVPMGDSDEAITRTPALALCAAALRARASLPEEG